MKNSMMLLQALEGVDLCFVEQAKPGKARKRTVLFSAMAAAACIALLISIFSSGVPGTSPNGPSIQVPPTTVATKPTEPSNPTNPTNPTVDPPEPQPETLLSPKMEYEAFSKGIGGGPYSAWVYDLSDLKYPDPQGVTTLPIYRNLWVRDGAGMPPQMTDAQETALIQRIQQQIAPLNRKARFTVDDGHSVSVHFEESIILPAEYRYKWGDDYAKAHSVAEYFLATYGEILNMQEPVVDIRGGECNIYGQQSYRIGFYDGSGTTVQQVTNQNFGVTTICFDEDGNLSGFGIQTEELAVMRGLYELITPEQAEELLLQGYYLGQQELAEGHAVEGVRLMYWTWGMLDYYIPYYECLVEAPRQWSHKNDLGIKTYWSYYVPAIDLERYCQLTGAQILE